MEAIKELIKKNPKLLGSLLVIVLSVLMASFADLKPILQEVCAGIELKQE